MPVWVRYVENLKGFTMTTKINNPKELSLESFKMLADEEIAKLNISVDYKLLLNWKYWDDESGLLDNIHKLRALYLHLPSLNKNLNADILDTVFERRLDRILSSLNLSWKDELIYYTKKEKIGSMMNRKIIELEVFGVKDTLRTIDEYIAEIKESDMFKNFIATKIAETIITEENISDYYEFMSDTDLEKIAGLVAFLLGNRDREVFKILFNSSQSSYDDDFTTFTKHCDVVKNTSSTYSVKQFIFGIQDTLQPLEDYIKEIESSEGYKEVIEQDKFNYMMLSRLSHDVVQFLSEDSFSYQKIKNLWAGNIDEQIKEMRKIYNNITIKPEWLNEDDINTYEKEMKVFTDYRQSIFLKNGKSPACTNVLQLMDKDSSYSDALRETLLDFDGVAKEDLELELDIYC